jgi:hypothetical protein
MPSTNNRQQWIAERCSSVVVRRLLASGWTWSSGQQPSLQPPQLQLQQNDAPLLQLLR